MTDAVDVLDAFEALAQYISGSIYSSEPGQDKLTLIEEDGFLAVRDATSLETKCCDPEWGKPASKARMSRLSAISVFLEAHRDFEKDERYIVTVTDWPERGEEVARWIVEATDLSAVHVNLTPARLDNRFDGDPVFGSQLISNPVEGGQRFKASAEIIGIFDHLYPDNA